MKNLICDLEGTTFNGKDKKTKVWLSCISDYDVSEHYIVNEDIESFMTNIYNYCKTANILMHDLGGYDAQFIIDWLKKQGFVHYSKMATVEQTNFYIGDSSTNFTVFWDGHVYNFFDTMNFLKFPLRKVAETLNMKKEDIPLFKHPRKDTVEFFGEKPKGKYRFSREHLPSQSGLIPRGKVVKFESIKEHEATKSDFDYIKNNCAILKEATRAYNIVNSIENRIYSVANYSYQTMLNEGELPLKRITEFEPINKPMGYKQKYAEKRFNKITLNVVDRAKQPKGYDFKGSVGSATRVKSIEDQLDILFEKIEKNDFENSIEEEQIKKDFEIMKQYFRVQKKIARRMSYNRTVKSSFRGGFVYIKPDCRNKWLDVAGVTLDKNSCHPANYVKEKLPNQYIEKVSSYHELQKKYGSDDYVFFVKFAHLVADVQKDKVPIFKLREDDRFNLDDEFKLYENTANVPSHIDYEAYVITEMEYDYLNENYDISVADGVEFIVYSVHTELMKRMRKHGLYWYDKKVKATKEHDAFARANAKNMLNFPVGYLGVNPEKHLSKNFGKISSQSNVASASFINAYARVRVAEEANRIGLKYYLYGDTDSLHLRIPEKFVRKDGTVNKKGVEHWLKEKGVDIDDTKLGAWKIERWFKKAKFITIRVYGEVDENDNWVSKVSGFKGTIPMEDFESGKEVFQNLRETVEGGTLIMKTSYIVGH